MSGLVLMLVLLGVKRQKIQSIFPAPRRRGPCGVDARTSAVLFILAACAATAIDEEETISVAEADQHGQGAVQETELQARRQAVEMAVQTRKRCRCRRIGPVVVATAATRDAEGEVVRRRSTTTAGAVVCEV